MSASQKVVVVTGASQGIGAEVVKAFRKLDYRVVATSRTIQPSDDPDILAVAGDIGDPATAQRVISEAVARFGRIDTLVNNAGIYIGKPFTEYTTEDYNAVMNVNMAGFYHITKLAIAEMEKHASGHVVTVTASIDNGISGAHMALAALTKGGLNAATKTPMHSVEYHEMLGGLHPLGRMGEASEVASAVVFLDSAEFITGEILHVDGGQSAGR
jgi:NAD(P)-dependent dehydrogenase (short-subunit alcohol dehydrogenase family)